MILALSKEEKHAVTASCQMNLVENRK